MEGKWVEDGPACPVHPKAGLCPSSSVQKLQVPAGIWPARLRKLLGPVKWSYLYLSMDLSSGHTLPPIQFLWTFVGSQQAVLGTRKLLWT